MALVNYCTGRSLLTFRRVSKYVEGSLEVLEDSSAQSAYIEGLSLVDFTLASAKRPYRV